MSCGIVTIRAGDPFDVVGNRHTEGPSLLHLHPALGAFFYELGMKVVESGSTNKHIVDLGVKTTVTDACAPIKIFQGHVEALARKVDVVFIPRMVSFEGGYVFCPKFLGLSDMVKATVDDLPPVVDTRFDLRKGLTALLRALVRLGTELGAGRMKAFAAAVRAIRHFKQLDGQPSSQGPRRWAEC